MHEVRGALGVMTRYIYMTCPTGFAWVERGGELVKITHGDPEYDALAAKMAKHLASSLVETNPDAEDPANPPLKR